MMLKLLLLCYVFVLTKGQVCPDDYSEHPLLLISMDGFRYDYPQRNLTPTINAFRDAGVSTPYMKSSYPSITFPNHYTIVTGLYPESHGIVGNHFIDHTYNVSFDMGDSATLNGSWWGGDPIWNTVQKPENGDKKSATMFWPGSDANIEYMYPTYYYVYDGSVPFEDRIQQVLDWLALPVDERPIFISLYFDEPDHTAHSFGPDTQQVDEVLVEMDGYFKDLLDGITALGLINCVNIILLADHGMATAGESRVLNLYDFDPDITDEGYIEYGPIAMIYADDEADIDPMRKDFACKVPQMRQYSKETMPTRTHFTYNNRIGDVILDLNPGYTVDTYNEGETPFYLGGQHGYDNIFELMQPVFTAKGPDFKEGVTIQPFQNIEVYNLMCTLIGITPSPNNGTEGSLYNALKNPPPYPVTPTETAPDSPPFPDNNTITSRLDEAGCPGDYADLPGWIFDLNYNRTEQSSLEELHLPWGIPLSGNLTADLILLYHPDHITGYSNYLKMPLWTSFTISEHTSGTSVSDWTSDVRLESSNSPTCQSYDDIAAEHVTMQPLFPRRYSSSISRRDLPYLVSNAVPMSSATVTHWTELTYNFVTNWLDQASSPLNVVLGPAFDYDFNSLVDNYNSLSNSDPIIPTHMYASVTRCLTAVTDLADCSPQSLDAIGFIMPQKNDIPNCLNADDYALEYSAKIKDIEIITGLTFFPDLSYEDRIRLEIRGHSNLWYKN